ncbi:MAG TPA: amidase [Stellaceae bacterium]|nr:amidase [Stellaceae bacterium]
MAELTDLGLVELAEAIRARLVSSREATEAALARARTVQPATNAFIALDEAGALAAADAADRALARGGAIGPLHGVPLAHKDMFFRKGRVSGCGSAILRDVPADRTATVLARLDNAGALDIARLNMAEFAFGPTGHNVHYGDGRNPWDPARITGGSSSGSGAAVAARAVWGALGSDTGGSIRLPAALCGIVGLKPTHTRVSRYGAMGLSFSLDTIGPLARTVRDAARLLAAIAGPDPCDPTAASHPVGRYEEAARAGAAGGLSGVRIGVPGNYYGDDLDPEIRGCWQDGAKLLAGLGAEIVEVKIPLHEHLSFLANAIAATEGATLHGHWMRTRKEDYSPQVRARIEMGFAVPARHYLAALTLRPRLVREFCDRVFAACDALWAPALAQPAPERAATDFGDGPDMVAGLAELTRLLRPFNYLGLPVVALPAGFDRNAMPIGMQLAGPPFAEARLVRIAAAFENAAGLAARRPPL